MSDAPRRTRLGVMGGTFDPIHHGHLVAASEVQGWFDLDEVVFVPTGQPWQKADREVAPAEHRYLMTVVATAANPRFTVSRVDIDRDGPTYTIDTLRDLRAQRPDADLYFITGADALTEIFSWRDADELFELAHFVGCTRPGAEMDPETLDRIPHDRVTMVEIPALAISSTECRQRQRAGHPVWYLVPDGVVQYITKHGLYAADRSPEVEEVAQQLSRDPRTVSPEVEEVAQQPSRDPRTVSPEVEEVAQQPSRDPGTFSGTETP